MSGQGLNQYYAADNVSSSRTQHSDTVDCVSITRNPLIPSLTLCQLSQKMFMVNFSEIYLIVKVSLTIPTELLVC